MISVWETVTSVSSRIRSQKLFTASESRSSKASAKASDASAGKSPQSDVTSVGVEGTDPEIYSLEKISKISDPCFFIRLISMYLRLG